LFLPWYSICALSWCSMGFAYPFMSISIQSFRYNNLAFILLFLSWCLSFPLWGSGKGHQETCIHLHRYMGGNWEALQEEQYMIKTFILVFQKHLESILNLTPPPSAWLRHARAFQAHTIRIIGFSN
jgi:hypothetical protein